MHFYCAIPHFHPEVRMVTVMKMTRNISYRETYGIPGLLGKESVRFSKQSLDCGCSDYEPAPRPTEFESLGLEIYF